MKSYEPSADCNRGERDYFVWVFMEEDLSRAKQYSKRQIQLTIIQIILTIAFLLIMLLSGASMFLKKFVAFGPQNFYLQIGFYIIIFAIVYYIVFAGLDFYDSFLLEHKFQLSNQSVLDWLKKNIKMGLLALLIFLITGEALYFFLRHFQDSWWLLATVGWLLLTVVLGKITPVLIIPLFYKCSPLTNIPLRERLLGLSERCGISVKDVFEIQLSKDTKKANAALAGFGKGRRILLGDTLLKNYSDNEIEAVFAHELGHLCLWHIWKILVFGTVASFLSFYLTSLIFKASIGFFGFEHIYDIAAFPLLALVLMVVGLVLMPIQNWYMRHLEKQADMFALSQIETKQSFASAMSKLANQNLSDPSPSKFAEILFYTHPPISKRLHYANEKAM